MIVGAAAFVFDDAGRLLEWLKPDAIPEPRSNVLHHGLDDAFAGRRGIVRAGLPRIT